MSDSDRDEAFAQVLASYLRDDLAPAGQACLAPGVAAAYFAGALSESEAHSVETHLVGCAPCQAEMALLAGLEASDITEPDVPREASRLLTSNDDLAPVVPHPPSRQDAPPASRSVPPTSEAPPSEAAAAGSTEPAPESPLIEQAELVALRRDAEWFPRRRRTSWTWVGAAGLSVAAVLAIVLTYRSTPLIEEASRRATDTEAAAPRAATEAMRSKDAEQYVPSAPPEPQPAPTAAPFFSDEPREDSTDVSKESAPLAAAGATASTTPPISGRAVEVPPRTPPEAHPGSRKSAPATSERTLAKAKQELPSPPVVAQPVPPTVVPPATAASAAGAPRPVVVVARSNLDVTWRLTGTEIERSDDAGKTWVRQPAATESPLVAGSAPSDGVCWVAGAKGTVLRSNDGRTWERLASPTSADIVQITAWSVLNASIRTADGERFSTDDGGQTWSKP